MIENLKELYQYRALLFSLIGRELKVRYRGSVLGFLWTFLNPVCQMLVYSLVFSVYMRSSIDNYTYFLFVGLLPWNWFATSLLGGTTSVSDRRDLITKVKFPPQILPMTVIGSAFVNYLFTLPLMFGFALITHVQPTIAVVAFPLVVLTQALLATGLVYILATINVGFRDLQHILGNLLMFALFLTPVLYPLKQIPERFHELLLLVNPMAPVIMGYQAIFFYGTWPDFVALGRVAGLGLALVLIGSAYMSSRREGFAEVA